MSKFNTPAEQAKKTVNLAGGEAYTESPQLELVSIMLTNLTEDQAYRKASGGIGRLEQLIDLVNPVFAAKAAIYARKVFGMRSITHVAAVKLGKVAQGTEWGARFYEKIIKRPDDITEILALNKSKHGKAITHAMRKGLGKAMSNFKDYSLAKYKGERNELSMVDAANLLHPPHSDTIKKLVEGTLKQKNTWENQVSEAGKSENITEAKAEAWGDLLMNDKLGTFALLRNLRNILATNKKSLVEKACESLVNVEAIKRSMLFPYRFFTAYKEIEKITSSEARLMLDAISEALDIAVDNMPKMDNTCVVLDSSGSMAYYPMSDKSDVKIAEAGLVLAVAMAKRNNSDMMFFDTDAQYINIRPKASVMDNVAMGLKHIRGGATDFKIPFIKMNKAYDKIIILSDMQGWVGYDSPKQAFDAYRSKFNCNPKVYSVDMTGNGSLQFPENNVFAMAGFSDKIFDIMKMYDIDKKALIHKIEEVEL